MSEIAERPPRLAAISDGRLNIFHEAGQMPKVLDDILAALASLPAHIGLFVWSGGLYRIHHLPDDQIGNINRSKGSIILHPVGAAHLSEMITSAARNLKYDSRNKYWRDIDCPRRVAENVIDRGYWPELRRLDGIVNAPTITADWEIIDKLGYHIQGLYIAEVPLNYFSPPAEPSNKNVKDAIKLLLEVIETFPFVEVCDRSAALAAIITALIRSSLPSAPMTGITAPTPGTGKSLLADVISMIALGRSAPVFALGPDENETEKRLYSALRAGDSVLVLDNVEQPLRGAVLCQILTQSFVQFRPLGESSTIIVPTCTTLIATGNNLDVRGDLRRRVMLIRLDAKMERPEQRLIGRDALAYTKARRGALINAVLTLLKAYRAALPDPPKGLSPYGGFEKWDLMVRRPLIWAGLPDPLNGAESLRNIDPDLEATRALFSAWHDKYGDDSVTVADVLTHARESTPRFDGGSDIVWQDLKDALHSICGERLDARRLGGWLRRHRDRIVDGKQLVQADSDSHAKVARWRVIAAG